MPSSTANFGLLEPLVNNPTDADLWGGYLNTDLVSIDGLLLTALNWTASSQTTTITVTAMTPGSTTTGSNRVLYRCDATSGAFPANLPAAATAAGLTVAFKKTDSSANAITVTGNSSDKIDGSGTYPLTAQNQFVILVCDGTQWNIISQTAPSISAASTTVAGILKTATAAIALAGTDATAALTAASLAANATIGTNGSYPFPGGLILKWGTITTGGATSGTLTFPVAFTAACYGAFPMGNDSNTADRRTAVPSFSASAFNWTTSSNDSSLTWFALGK
jgi:hypothetical protein